MPARPVLFAGWVALLVATGCTDVPYPVVKVGDARIEGLGHSVPEQTDAPLRFSIASIESPRDTYAAYSQLAERISAGLGRRVEIVQRRTYGEVNELIATGQIDAALLCAGGFADLQQRSATSTEVIAVPVLGGSVTFRSLIIVGASSGITTVEGLAGKKFAYTDELSLSGREYPARLLKERGHDPDRFFATTIFTRSHDRSIASVAKGLVDGAAVQSHILEHLAAEDPGIRRRVRVVHESPDLGSMPVVVSRTMAPELRAKLRDVLLRLHEDPEAAAALRSLRIDGFAAPPRTVASPSAAVGAPR